MKTKGDTMKTLIRSLLMFGAILFLAACGDKDPPPAVNTPAVNTPDITVTDSVLPDNDLQVLFGFVTPGLNSTRTVTVTNNGTADLVIGPVGSGDPLAAPFSIPTENCSNQTIAPSGNCTLTVRFSSTSVASYDSFDIPSNDPDENPVTVSVSGTGALVPIPPAPNISVRPSNLSFGTSVACGVEITRTAIISNTGAASLGITSITLTSSGDFSIALTNCPASLISNSACTVDVLFSPGTSGTKTGTLRIVSDDPDSPTTNVGLSGARVTTCL